MCQKNVGRLDAYLRISAGVILTGVGIINKKSWLTVVGGMKIAAGVTRYCPVLDLIDFSTVSDEEFVEDILGMECADEIDCLDEEEYHYGHGHDCHNHGEHTHHEQAERRQYIHRGIKRNQYLNRDF